jgi:BirA family biotin operon repressor/biotin-[acetyl-CoA-carboxylase] ligase
MVDGAKLGGILVETRDRSYAVIGIGINCRPDPALEAKVGRKLAYLKTSASRNEVIQRIGLALLEAVGEFQRSGFNGVRAEWEAMDAHAGQRLRVRLADGRVVSGMANGLAPDGSLQLITRTGRRAVRSGRVVSAGAA